MIINTCIFCIFSFCWCVTDIICENIHGVKSFKVTDGNIYCVLRSYDRASWQFLVNKTNRLTEFGIQCVCWFYSQYLLCILIMWQRSCYYEKFNIQVQIHSKDTWTDVRPPRLYDSRQNIISFFKQYVLLSH